MTDTNRNVTYRGRPAYLVGRMEGGKVNLTVRRPKEERGPGVGPCYGVVCAESEIEVAK